MRSDACVCSGDDSDTTRDVFIHIYVAATIYPCKHCLCGGAFIQRTFFSSNDDERSHRNELTLRTMSVTYVVGSHESRVPSQTELSTCSKPGVLVTHVLWASLQRITLCV